MKEYTKLLQSVEAQLKPYDTNLADTNYHTLQKIFSILYESGILEITHLPKELQDDYKLQLFTTLSKNSGALAFLVIQILAANNIMTKHNYPKKDFYFKKRCGIAINHLRAPKTIVYGEKSEEGYFLNGPLTWASGYKIFDTLLIGFHCDGEEFEALAPFDASKGFHIGEVDNTFVGYGLNTVNITLENFFVKKEDIVSSNPMGNYTKNKSASKTVHFCLYGLGIGAVENSNDSEFQQNALLKLNQIKENFLKSSDTEELDVLRVKLFALVQEIVTTAMVLIGGKSILSCENLQRIYKELIMFNSNGLNNKLKLLFKERFLLE